MDETLLLLAERIGEERRVILEDMGMGRAKDFAQYQHSSGVLLGFMKVQSLIADMMKSNWEDGDDE